MKCNFRPVVARCCLSYPRALALALTPRCIPSSLFALLPLRLFSWFHRCFYLLSWSFVAEFVDIFKHTASKPGISFEALKLSRYSNFIKDIVAIRIECFITVIEFCIKVMAWIIFGMMHPTVLRTIKIYLSWEQNVCKLRDRIEYLRTKIEDKNIASPFDGKIEISPRLVCRTCEVQRIWSYSAVSTGVKNRGVQADTYL